MSANMFRKLSLVLGFWAALAVPAHAAWFSSGSSELQQILTAPEITIEDYEVSTEELNIFYTARGYKPAWDFEGQDKEATFNAFLDSIEKLIEYHGLQREDYAVGLMRKLEASSEPDSKTKLELLVTDTLLRLAHDLHGDTMDLAELYVGWNFNRNEIDIPNTLAGAVANNSLNDYIESLTPKNPAYTKLAQALLAYRTLAAKGEWPKIDKGGSLKLKDHGPRVVQLRERLAAEGYLPPILIPEALSDVFDGDLERALLAYQTRNGIEVDGAMGSKALEALNTPIKTRIDQILANMERWRHMPDDFPPDRYTLVNIPNATIDITEDGKPIYHGIVIVGRVDRKTPFIQSQVRSMIINPAWHVPTKIARKDILPKLRKDPHYLEKMGFVIRGSEDDPHGDTIDWSTMKEREFNFRLRQSPGDMNSLGRLKFDFDNDFAVYMHGTPHQELFKKNERSLSSGCVRLHDPTQVAEIILSHNKNAMNAEQIEEAIQSNETHWIGITKPMPLYVVYWSVFVDDADAVNFRKDIYDYDGFLMQAMRSEPGVDDANKTPPYAPAPSQQ